MKINRTNGKVSYYKDTLKRFRKHKLALIGCTVLVLEILIFFILPLIIQLDPFAIDKTALPYSAPSKLHIMGTDAICRDNFARYIYGGKVSIVIGILTSVLAFIIGMPLGMLAGYYRGVTEMIIMRFCEIMQCLPAMVVILLIASVAGPSLVTLIAIMGFLSFPSICRLTYANVISYKEKDYVEAARAIGTKNGKIMFQYILPNAVSPLLVAFTFNCAGSILMESGLSYLGLGVKAPQASLGNILNSCRSIAVISSMPWMWVIPGITLIVTVLCINFVGDGLRDAFDPRTKI